MQEVAQCQLYLDDRTSPASAQERANDYNWPGRAKAEFKLAAVNLSSKAGQQGKF